jgi:hypothetical protein
LPIHQATSSTKTRVVRSRADGLNHPQTTNTIHAGPSIWWDPRVGPIWIHEIIVWDPHYVGPTHFSLWGPQFYRVGFLSLINLNHRGFLHTPHTRTHIAPHLQQNLGCRIACGPRWFRSIQKARSSAV